MSTLPDNPDFGPYISQSQDFSAKSPGKNVIKTKETSPLNRAGSLHINMVLYPYFHTVFLANLKGNEIFLDNKHFMGGSGP